MCDRNLNYWDSVSTLAGEVAHPRKTFPRALFIGVALVVFMYLGPLLVGLGVTTDANNWELGYFTEVAKLVRDRQEMLQYALAAMQGWSLILASVLLTLC